MDTGDVLGRGIAFPPRIGPDGRLAFSAGEANVREAIEIILRTEQRERLRAPRFGGGLATLPVRAQHAGDAARRSRTGSSRRSAAGSRASRRRRRVAADPDDADAAIATIDYHLVATQAPGRGHADRCQLEG